MGARFGRRSNKPSFAALGALGNVRERLGRQGTKNVQPVRKREATRQTKLTKQGEQRIVLWPNRLKEVVAITSIGDGMVALIAPRNHMELWLLGPRRLRKLTLWFSENPLYTRLVAIVQVGFGMWLALRQYQEEAAPQPPPQLWYQRWFSQYRLLPGWLAPLLGLLALILIIVVVFRHTRGKSPSEGDQASDELDGEEIVEESKQAIRSIIRESVRRSRGEL